MDDEIREILRLAKLLSDLTEGNKSKYKEIIRLHEMLDEAGIPHLFGPRNSGYAIRYFGNTDLNGHTLEFMDFDTICDIVEFSGSYGADEDLLEVSGLIESEDGDSVVGYLSAEKVFAAIQDHYQKSSESDTD